MSADRSAVAEIVQAVGNFNPSEISCALELVDIYLTNPLQTDYCMVVAEDEGIGVCGYVCWGPTPMTRGAYDLYWIATAPGAQGRGIGRELMHYVETKIAQEQGRLIIVETSSKESYRKTIQFYRDMNYEEISRLRDFYDVGDDKLIFIKRLSR
jgi:ribosomal protein S18 acetylase RimI-like enzyme